MTKNPDAVTAQQKHDKYQQMIESMGAALALERWAVLFNAAMAIAEYARDRAFSEHKDTFGFE
jgi:hypothetical protein